ncbi:MAG: helix-turn-helix domain-containing protein [Propionicimonas sp.]|nr:helix-turn-helix domain-containing protein [Propionicimonas sp.]
MTPTFPRFGVSGHAGAVHLKVLREAGLIEGVKRGRWIDYSLTDGALERLHAALPDPASVARQLTVVR